MVKRLVLLCGVVLMLVACAPGVTPTAVPPTADPRATETQIARNIFATQTASVPTATFTPAATSTPTPEPGVLFDDDFSTEAFSRSQGWPLGPNGDGSADRIWSPNQYTLAVNRPDWISFQWPRGTYSNFGAEIEAQSKTAYAEYGIVFRMSGSGADQSYYAFGITTDGLARLRKNINGQWANQAIVPFSISDKIKTGQFKNKLGVIADNSEISLYINGFLVSTVQDTALTNGSVGIYVLTATNNTRSQVAFSRMTVFTAEKGRAVMGRLPAALATRTPVYTPTRPPTSTPRATATPPPTPTPPPPAKIVATMPQVIPCHAWGDNGCQWDFTVTFKEVNGGDATITRIGRRYIDTRGRVWTATSGEWSNETIRVYGNDDNIYSSWVRTTNGNDLDLRDGTVVVSYQGRDTLGNTFEGSVSAHLAPSPVAY